MNPIIKSDSRILVVDDDVDFAKILAVSLRRRGFDVQTANSGIDALKLIGEGKFEVVLSDVLMPNGSGIELITELRSLGVQLPVVFLMSGFADLTIQQALRLGAEALFSKPFDMKSIEEAICGITGKPIQREERIKCKCKFDIDIHVQGIEESILSKVININKGGMFIEAPESFFPNVYDRLKFSLASKENSVGEASGEIIVRWARIRATKEFPSGFGVEFLRIDSSLSRRLNELSKASG